jgi:hypothetical protein
MLPIDGPMRDLKDLNSDCTLDLMDYPDGWFSRLRKNYLVNCSLTVVALKSFQTREPLIEPPASASGFRRLSAAC